MTKTPPVQVWLPVIMLVTRVPTRPHPPVRQSYQTRRPTLGLFVLKKEDMVLDTGK